MAQNQYYYFDIVTYSSTELVERVRSVKWPALEWFVYCVHHHDWQDPLNHNDLLLKDRHIHVVLKTHCQHSIKAVLNWFYDADHHQNTFVSKCDHPVGAVRYLQHLDDPTKYQYLRTEVFAYGIDYDAYITKADISVDLYREMYYDFYDGMSHKDLVDKYGQLFIRNRHLLSKIADEDRKERTAIASEMSYMQGEMMNEYCYNMFGSDSQE